VTMDVETSRMAYPGSLSEEQEAVCWGLWIVQASAILCSTSVKPADTDTVLALCRTTPWFAIAALLTLFICFLGEALVTYECRLTCLQPPNTSSWLDAW